MDSFYALNFDARTKLLRVTFTGHWTPQVVTAYEQDRRAVALNLAKQGFAANDVLLLVDARAQGPQSPEVVAGLARLMQDAALKPRRTAVLASSALRRRQADRIASNGQVFASEDDAVDWLMVEDRAA